MRAQTLIRSLMPAFSHFPCPLIPCHAVPRSENVPVESHKGCTRVTVCDGGENRYAWLALPCLTSEVLLCCLELP